MKAHIHTLQDTLAFQLEGLYYAEKKIKEDFDLFTRDLTSQELKEEITKYILMAQDKLLKLDRIFNYLMQEPEVRRSKAVIKLLEETRDIIHFTDSPHLKDIVMVGCLQNINAYKISALKTAYMFTVELEMDTASDLLQQILESELETCKALAILAIEEFNKGHDIAA